MYEHELEVASRLVVELGENMQDALMNADIGTIDLKEDYSYLTDTDRGNNRRGIQILKQEFPHDGVRGEEESDLNKNDRRRWVLDPVDGTFPFICGIPTSVILLGLEENGVPLVSCMYSPYVKRLYCAAKGVGAFLNGKQVRINREQTPPTLNRAAIGTCGPDPSSLFDLAQVRFDLAKAGAKIQVLGSTGHETAMVGLGKFAGQVFGGETGHDVIFGDLFVGEVGGVSSNIFGDCHDFSAPIAGSVMSVNGRIHDALLEIIEPNLTKPWKA